ncbi:MAG: 30S ribosomal protein S12 methylthiotransferase RimO [Candidatus Eisenbacteria bacterium]
MPTNRVFIHTLGCPKNEVDSEVMAGILRRDGWEIAEAAEEADLILINTCTFIDDAKEESIGAVLEAGRAKGARKLLVAGCLAERYGADLLREVPEIDGLTGVRSLHAVGRAARKLFEISPRRAPDSANGDGDPDRIGEGRLPLGRSHTAYLKIAEGCDRPCAFCSIPAFRGPLRSRSIGSLEREARSLAARGARELVLVAQETTAYGKDLGDGSGLPALIDRLHRIEKIRWVRVLYAYPSEIGGALIERLADGRACRYLDIPAQHASDRMLRAMRRGMSGSTVRGALERLRTRVPGIALRSSLLVGFPGETDADFDELLRFAEEAAFEHLGVFRFSPQEGTEAASLPNPVPDDLAEERMRMLLDLQERIVERRTRGLIGRSIEVLVDGEDEEGVWARSESDAPEIDGAVILPRGSGAPGDFLRARITGAAGPVLFAETGG